MHHAQHQGFFWLQAMCHTFNVLCDAQGNVQANAALCLYMDKHHAKQAFMLQGKS